MYALKYPLRGHQFLFGIAYTLCPRLIELADSTDAVTHSLSLAL